MTHRAKFLLFALLFIAAHLAVHFYAIDRLSAALDHNAPVESRFAPSFAVALSMLPLLRLTIANSVMVGVGLAFALMYLPRRAVAVIALASVLLLYGAMFGTALWLETRVERGWKALAPHVIEAAPSGDLVTTLGTQPIDAVRQYLDSEIARGDDLIDAPPQEVEWFLVAHRSEIAALRHRLPSTRSAVELFHLQKILLVDALQERSGEDVAAARRLTEVLLREPDQIHVLYAIAATENQLGVIRKLELPQAALPSFDPHRRLIDAIAAQAARLRTISPPWYVQPYSRLCLAESAMSAVRHAEQIASANRCRFDAEREIDRSPAVPFNPTGVLPDGAAAAVRANRLLLDLEGTERILAVKRGERPPSTSRCADRHWILEDNELRLEPALPAGRPFLPTRHLISARPASRSL